MNPPVPPRAAIALSYDGNGAPRVIAKGEGVIARRIIELAGDHDIPMTNDEGLVSVLSRVPLGDEVPESLYIAVARVLAFAYRVSGREAPRPAAPVGTDSRSGSRPPAQNSHADPVSPPRADRARGRT